MLPGDKGHSSDTASSSGKHVSWHPGEREHLTANFQWDKKKNLLENISIKLNCCTGTQPIRQFILHINSIINLRGIYVACHQPGFSLENK